MDTLTVDLDERSYPIYIGEGVLFSDGNSGELLAQHVIKSQVLIVTNVTIAPLYLEKLKQSLKGFDVSHVILPDGEVHKNLTTLNLIFDGLLSNNHNRMTTLVALGGGVIGDMTGFAAACYQRGVAFIQVPTTLLSQVDSSVGGKTGVNHALGKNMIGAFHQPQSVIIDIETLQTLPDRELSAGLAEVIKYGLIKDIGFLVWLEKNMAALLARDSEALTYAILRSCELKSQVVAEDEKESGIRAILNLGHTFGHAIETVLGYGQWLHGEAVAVGMAMAADLSASKGWLSYAEVERTKQLIKSARLPVCSPVEMSAGDYLAPMRMDKKVLDGKIRLVLLEALGNAVVTSDVDESQIINSLIACGAKEV